MMSLGTILHFSTTYHPQTNGQSEWTIHMLKVMLRARVMHFGGSWESYLHLAEFSYTNNCHFSISTPPYELINERKFQTLVCWGEFDHRFMRRTEVVRQTTELIQQIM